MPYFGILWLDSFFKCCSRPILQGGVKSAHLSVWQVFTVVSLCCS